jgi:hypothetical protein
MGGDGRTGTVALAEEHQQESAGDDAFKIAKYLL